MSDFALPSDALLRSGWRPLIVEFVRRLLATLQFGPGGVGATSWFRTAQRNRIEGGSPESQHLVGLAMDLVVPQSIDFGREPQELRAAAERAGLIAVPNLRKGFLHVQLFPAGALARAGVTFPR